jgi:hypothetical protein
MFFLTNSSGCSAKKKSLHAEQSGAKLLIIMLDENETLKSLLNKFQTYDYSEIDIPTIVVNYETG